jgi:hypothetical protein
VPADEAAENDIVESQEDLESGKDLIDIVNEYGKNRGKFKKGSNKNPITGTGGRTKKQEKQPDEATIDKETTNAEEEDK